MTVTATNIDTGVELTTHTSDTGTYNFLSVVPGEYTMTASLPGFKTSNVSSLRISDSEILQDITLDLAPARAAVNPTAASCSGNGIPWCALLHRTK